MVFGASQKVNRMMDQATVKAALARQHFGAKAQPGGGSNVGVGIVLNAEPTSGIKYVRKLTQGGPAEKSGTIGLGDRVLSVNGTDLWTLTLQECRDLMLCEPVIALSMQKRNEKKTCADDEWSDYDISLERCNIDEIEEELLERFIYTKGRGSFLRGTGILGSQARRRWVALRNGSLIITKGPDAKISKVVDLTTACTLTDMVQTTSENKPEFFFGIKVGHKSTLYFGDQDCERVRRFATAILRTQNEDAVLQRTFVKGGFCAARGYEENARDYGMLTSPRRRA